MQILYFIAVLGLPLAANAIARDSISLGLDDETPDIVSEIQEPMANQNVMDRDFGNRCGPDIGRCADGNCCSTAGYCGNTTAHCRSPDCQIDYGHCDAHATPGGPSTEQISRPRIGNVPYGPQAIRSCIDPGTVALTYDDGPNQYTGDLLDILDYYNAKATFFVTGNNNGKGQIDDSSMPWPALIQRMQRSGHQIASHTWSHQDLNQISQIQRRTQLLWNEVALRNILGSFPTYMRPPYSSCTQDSGCLDDMGELGYHVILYDIDTEDFRNDSPDAIQLSKDIFDKNFLSGKPSDKSWLIIAHDVHEQTVHNLTQHMLEEILGHGYRAVTVGECLGDPKEFWYRKDDNFIKAPDSSTPGTGSSISMDGRCGGSVTCAGSSFGWCCGSGGYCGNSSNTCGADCQPNAGWCSKGNTGSESLVAITDPLSASKGRSKKLSKSDADLTFRWNEALQALLFLAAIALLW